MSKSSGAILILVLIIIGFAIFVWGNSANKDKTANADSGTSQSDQATQTTETGDAGKLGANEIKITADNFQKEVIDASKSQLVVVDVYAPWCPHCQNMAPIFTQLSDEYKGKAKFGKMNADYQDDAVKANYDLATSLGFQGYPTFFFYKDGNLLNKDGKIGDTNDAGEIPIETFKKLVEQYK